EVSAGGSGVLSAGRDLTLDSLDTHDDFLLGRNTTRESQEIGIQLNVGGSLALLAGQDITTRAAEITSGDDLELSAGRDIQLEAGLSHQYEETRRGRTHTIERHSQVQHTTLDAGGDLLMQAGNDLRLTAGQLQADGSAALLADNRIDLLTAQEEDYSFYESSRRGGLFSSSRYQRDEVHDVRAVGTDIDAGGDLLIASGGDQTYQGARLTTGSDLALLSEGAIHFDTASDIRGEAHERSRGNFAWQSASGQGRTEETLRQSELRYQGELAIQAAQGITIDVPEVNAQSVRQTIDAMAEANPDLAWLQAMEARGDIDWRQVEAIHDSWNYSQSGLGPGAALAVSIVSAAWAGPAAGGLINNAMGAAMVNAG
ncbi:hemagglutinin repeat-containing protein, partial [Vreelandella olivaria]|uniref:hemagglutinin repeat-containing protein n=1 Tax=Vreelandella olivaria TaxID=390919 RepID=UPI00201F42C6